MILRKKCDATRAIIVNGVVSNFKLVAYFKYEEGVRQRTKMKKDTDNSLAKKYN